MSQNEKAHFQWVVVICDDLPSEPAIEQTINLLRKANLAVNVITNSCEFIDKANVLSLADIVLMDMKWGNFGKEQQSGTPPLRLPDILGSDRSSFVRDWINAIHFWSGIDQDLLVPNDAWPRARISQNEIGVWLAAMVSHVVPKAQLVIFSSLAELINRGIPAALGRFHDAVYDIQTKPSDGLSIARLTRQLSRRQQAELQNPVIYNWYLADVLFPLLLQSEPLAKGLELPSKYGKDPVVFDANTFFPDIKDMSNNDKIQALLRFLRPVKMSDEQLSSLSSCSHEISKKKRNAWINIPIGNVKGQLVRASRYAAMAGDFGAAAYELIQQAISVACPIDACRIAEEADTVIKEQKECRPLRWVKRLCSQYKGGFSADINSVIPYFNIGGFDKVIRALALHADNKYQLTCIAEANALEIQFLTNWQEIEIANFKKCVMDSLEKGPDRGLPYALLFGLLNGAATTEFLIADFWYVLHPDPFKEPTKNQGGVESFNFGIRWKFLINS